MNRTQAVERVDEILDLFAEMYVSGRCPRCEALLYDAEAAYCDSAPLPSAVPPSDRMMASGSGVLTPVFRSIT